MHSNTMILEPGTGSSKKLSRTLKRLCSSEPNTQMHVQAGWKFTGKQRLLDKAMKKRLMRNTRAAEASRISASICTLFKDYQHERLVA